VSAHNFTNVDDASGLLVTLLIRLKLSNLEVPVGVEFKKVQVLQVSG
jgi:hypothetical protein